MKNSNDWQLINEPNSTFVYELNKEGTNKWCLQVQGGLDDRGNRMTQEDLHKIACKLRSADELRSALEDLLYYAQDGSPRHYAMAVDNAEKALMKARGN